MRRGIGSGAIALAGLLLVTSAASGGFGLPSYENEFEGRAERDRGTYVGFNLKGSGDARKLVKVKSHLPYNCQNGEAGYVGSISKGKLKVKANGTFGGTLKVKLPSTRTRGGALVAWQWTVKGRLVSKRKARGTIDATLRQAKMEGSSKCYTGVLNWKARKGADLEPDFGAAADR